MQYGVLLALVSAPLLYGEVDARELIRRAVAADERNWQAARTYPTWERVDFRRLDSQGRLKSKEVKIYDVTLPEGSPYRRLAGRDDNPLPPAEDRKERAKLESSVAERRKQSERQKAERVAAYEERPGWQREAWRELADAFDFRMAGEEVLDNRTVHVIDATPHPGYQPRSSTAKVFSRLRGKLWVDAQSYQVVKAEAEIVGDIWVGLFLVRLSKGSRAIFEQARVTDEVWLPLRVRAVLSARIGLVKMLYIEHDVSYSRDNHFETLTSRIKRD